MEVAVFAVVVFARFVVPLAIPRFPLPAIVLALVIDAADQTVFAAFDAEPANYQGYDKALDIYYLTVAYLSTIRNWTNGAAFRTGQLLWYYRLVGVVAFELSGARPLLLIFPNTFEYYFIFYETVRLWWSPNNMARRTVVGAAVAIWVGIKLPQKYWIHIAQLDVTEVLGENPWIWAVLGTVAAIALVAGRRWASTLPPVDWPTSLAVDTHPTTVLTVAADPTPTRWSIIDHPLVEKTLLVGLVITIFLQLVPNSDRTVIQVTFGVGVIVVASAYASYWIGSKGRSWAAAGGSFVGTGAINLGVAFVFGLLPGRNDGDGASLPLAVLLIGLLTLIVVLYDRFRALRLDSATMAEGTSTTGDHQPVSRCCC